MTAKILIVEDNPQNMRLVAMVLKAKGYALDMAVDGPAALEAARRQRPDLIVMDMQLPGKSGFEVAACLRQTPGFERVPIVAVTAYAMKGDREKCLAAGCDAYLSKPIDTRALPELVASLLARARVGDNRG